MKCLHNVGGYLFALACLLAAPPPSAARVEVPTPPDKPGADHLPPGTAIPSPYVAHVTKDEHTPITDDQRSRFLGESDARTGDKKPKSIQEYYTAIGGESWYSLPNPARSGIANRGYQIYLRHYGRQIAHECRTPIVFSSDKV